jgi:hypothetical protein
MEKGWGSAVLLPVGNHACILVGRYGRIYFAFFNEIQRNKPEGTSRKKIKKEQSRIIVSKKKKSKGEEKKKMVLGSRYQSSSTTTAESASFRLVRQPRYTLCSLVADAAPPTLPLFPAAGHLGESVASKPAGRRAASAASIFSGDRASSLVWLGRMAAAFRSSE